MTSSSGVGDKLQYVFLDRDGVINRKAPEGQWISDWKDFKILPGMEAAIATLNAAGCKVIIVTNQRGIALRRFTEEDLRRLHAALREHLATHHAHIDALYYCPHERGVCECRKPGAGLFEQALRDFPEAVPANSVMIGDSLSDIEAGVRLGMQTVFIESEPGFPRVVASEAAALATYTAASLHEFVRKFGFARRRAGTGID